MWGAHIVTYPWRHNISAGVDIGDASHKPVRVDCRRNIGIDKSHDLGVDRRQASVAGGTGTSPVTAPDIGVLDGRGGVVVDDKTADAVWHLRSVHRRTQGWGDDGDPIRQGCSVGASIASSGVKNAGIDKASDERRGRARTAEGGSNALTASWCDSVDR